MANNYWMINCNRQNFEITRELGFTRQGLKAEYRRKVQRVEPGDRIIYYVNGIRVFAATATVTRPYEEVVSAPWVKEGKAAWPYRIGIAPEVVLAETQYIDAGMLAYRLEYLRKWPPEDWPLAFQGNLHLLPKSDFFLLEGEMLKARDGREKALREIDARLAEEERSNTPRERERRRPAPAGRSVASPSRAPRWPRDSAAAPEHRPTPPRIAGARPATDGDDPARPSPSPAPRPPGASRRIRRPAPPRRRTGRQQEPPD